MSEGLSPLALVYTEKVGNSLLAPSWYREALICYYIRFIISRVVNSFCDITTKVILYPFIFIL
jgi:hypothetical protein